MQGKDGNFVCRPNDNDGESGKPTFATDTADKGKGPFQLILQKDGNLVLYKETDKKPKPIYATQTQNKGKGPWRLVLTDDGILEIIDSLWEVIWKTERMDKTLHAEKHRDL